MGARVHLSLGRRRRHDDRTTRRRFALCSIAAAACAPDATLDSRAWTPAGDDHGMGMTGSDGDSHEAGGGAESGSGSSNDGGGTSSGSGGGNDATNGGAEASTTAPPTTDTGCQAQTCAGLGAECGSIDDGCGTTLNCGTCTGDEVCGGDGMANTCVDLGACPAAPASATAEQLQAYDRMNEVRAEVGAPCAAMNEAINAAAQSHSDYGATNFNDPTCGPVSHRQMEGCPGFTGVNFSARLSAAGYSGGTGEIVHYLGSPTAAINGWLNTLWHRVPIVLPQTLDYGFGTAAAFDTMDFGRHQGVAQDGVWFYPPDGATGVATQGGNESPPPPDPPAGCGTWGQFITIMFGTTNVTIDEHSLSGPSGDEVYEWITPSASSSLRGTVYAMVPCPLERSSEYTIHVRGSAGGTAFDRSSTFTTN